MKYISFCSGIEAASVAWEKLGWTPVAFSEIAPFPCAVLKERFPDVPNLGDCRNIHYKEGTLFVQANENDEIQSQLECGAIDLAVGGFPCTSLSIAGRRDGLEGASGIVLEYPRLCFETHARWMVLENVPGMLSSGSGRDFAAVLSGFAGWEVPVPKGGWKNSGIVQNNPNRGGGITGWHGELWTRNTREFPDFPGQFRNIADGFLSSDTVASLSDILWTGPVPPQYYLTAKHSQGILRRVENRGHGLPEILRMALERQISDGK